MADFETVHDALDHTGLTGVGGGVTAVQTSALDSDGAADITTTSTTFVDLTGASITVTTGARKVKVGFMCTTLNNTANALNAFTIAIDGTDKGGSLGYARSQNATANGAMGVALTYMTPSALTAASHTFKIRWRVSAGTGTVKNLSASTLWHMWVEECPT